MDLFRLANGGILTSIADSTNVLSSSSALSSASAEASSSSHLCAHPYCHCFVIPTNNNSSHINTTLTPYSGNGLSLMSTSIPALVAVCTDTTNSLLNARIPVDASFYNNHRGISHASNCTPLQNTVVWLSPVSTSDLSPHSIPRHSVIPSLPSQSLSQGQHQSAMQTAPTSAPLLLVNIPGNAPTLENDARNNNNNSGFAGNLSCGENDDIRRAAALLSSFSSQASELSGSVSNVLLDEKSHILDISGLNNNNYSFMAIQEIKEKSTSHEQQFKHYKCGGKNGDDISLPVREPQSKRYRCNICARWYQSEKGLKRHERIHDPATRGCPFCHKKFARKSYLHDHIRTHTGEKPYPCSSCHKSFACKRNLNQHIRTHSNLKRYRCHLCDRRFRVNQSLKVHLVKVHS